MSIVFSILLFSFLIFIHEFGHFIAAKLSGVKVNEFSMFMGPAIVQWGKGETKYSIRCIPIGGYCAMEGEDGDSEDPRSFQSASWWKRLCILIAGSFMNFLTGVLIIAVVLGCQPKYVSTRIAEVDPQSNLAAENGLRAGDEILELNGEKIRIYSDFTMETMFLEDGYYDMVVERNGQRVELHDVPMIRKQMKDENGNDAMLYGISFAKEETTVSSVLSQTLPTAGYHVKVVVFSLKMLFTGQAGLQDLGGPVQIVKVMSDSADASGSFGYALLSMLSFGAFLAINLAVMNMLPIPALDGGRCVGLILTTSIEKITKKKVNPKYEGYIHSVFMILLLAFMAFILFKDIFTIFKG